MLNVRTESDAEAIKSDVIAVGHLANVCGSANTAVPKIVFRMFKAVNDLCEGTNMWKDACACQIGRAGLLKERDDCACAARSSNQN